MTAVMFQALGYKVEEVFIWLPVIRQEPMTFISLICPESLAFNGLLESTARVNLTAMNRSCVKFLGKRFVNRRLVVSVPVLNFTT